MVGIGGIHFVLLADAVEQQLGVGAVGMHGGFGEEVDEGVDDAITSQFYIDYVLVAIDASCGNLGTVGVCFAKTRTEVLHQGTLECAVEDGLFVLDEGADAFAFEFADGAGTEIDDALVGIIDAVENAEDVLSSCWVAELQEDVCGFFCAENLEFVGILDVHDFIADVVGCFHKIDQWIACEGAVGMLGDAQFLGDGLVGLHFRAEKTELLLFASQRGRVRILHDGGKGGVGEDEPAWTTSLELMNEQTKGVGIAVEVDDVVPFLIGHHRAILLSFSLTEIRGNGSFSAMSERRIAHVVRQTSCTDDGSALADVG